MVEDETLDVQFSSSFFIFSSASRIHDLNYLPQRLSGSYNPLLGMSADCDPNTPRNRGPWTTANIVTAFRILLILPFIYLVLQGRFGLALGVFFLASLTDVADGYVARAFRQQSHLGRLLDPLADKLLTTAAFVVMAIPRAGLPSIPIWLAVAVVARDFLIVIGSLVVYLMTRFNEFTPSLLGKLNTFLELGLITCFLIFNTTERLTFLLPYLYLVVTAGIILSGTEYVIRGLLILKRSRIRA
ncbi:MAG TPA: CDP-alcohol phosphatidyltransferase family protein [Blastocatellia bacterium]